MTNSNVKIEELLALVKEGKLQEAQELYFDENIVTQEANGPLVKGKATAIQALKEFQQNNNVTGFRGYQVGTLATNEKNSLYTVTLQLEVNGNSTVDIEQVVHSQWENGKVVFERYYHA